jgi:hypothetical protein
VSFLASLALILVQLAVPNALYNYVHASLSKSVVQSPSQRLTTQSSSSAPKSGPSQDEVLTNNSVIELLKAQLEEDLIIAKIQKTKHNFDTSTKGIIELKQAGASSRLIGFMMDPTQATPLSLPTEARSPDESTQAVSNGSVQSTVASNTAAETIVSGPSPSDGEAIVPEKASSFDEFKHLVKARYGDQSLVLMVNGMYAGETGKGFLSGAGDTKLQYLHYHPSVAIPKKKRSSPIDIFGKKTNEMDQVDERTFGILESTQAVPLQRGDRLKVDRIEFLSDHIEFNLISTGFRSLSQIDINKSSKESRTITSGSEATQRVKIPNLGFRFKFFFDKEILKGGEFRTVVSEISKYLLLQQEAKAMLEAEKNLQIDQGMSEDEVLKRLGQPLRAVSFGETKTLIYRDMKVVLKNGKVVEVKVD